MYTKINLLNSSNDDLYLHFQNTPSLEKTWRIAIRRNNWLKVLSVAKVEFVFNDDQLFEFKVRFEMELSHFNELMNAENYTKAQIKEMKDWLYDCQWEDYTPAEIRKESAQTIVNKVDQFWDGGIQDYVNTNEITIK